MDAIKSYSGTTSIVSAFISVGTAFYTYNNITTLKKDMAELTELLKPIIQDSKTASEINDLFSRINIDIRDIISHLSSLENKIDDMEDTMADFIDDVVELKKKAGIGDESNDQHSKPNNNYSTGRRTFRGKSDRFEYRTQEPITRRPERGYNNYPTTGPRQKTTYTGRMSMHDRNGGFGHNRPMVDRNDEIQAEMTRLGQ